MDAQDLARRNPFAWLMSLQISDVIRQAQQVLALDMRM